MKQGYRKFYGHYPERVLADTIFRTRENLRYCKELLIPGAEVYLEKTAQPNRKTAYDLIAVRKNNGLLINIDSQAPNKVVREWLDSCDYDTVQPEFRINILYNIV